MSTDTTIHIVTRTFPPSPGGLETWTRELAFALESPKRRVVVHIGGNPKPDGFYNIAANETLRLRVFGSERALLEEPLVASQANKQSLDLERARIDILCLLNSVAAECKSHPSDKHILVSNYITPTGYHASVVSDQLGIPHIACVVGTDFSRGFYVPGERELFAPTVTRAARVVAFNGSQARLIGNLYPNSLITVIHPSVSLPKVLAPERIGSPPNTVALFSDCGYSYKKGTQVLLWAFAQLSREGLPLKLTLCGGMDPRQVSYWIASRERFSQEFPSATVFYDLLSLSEVRHHLSTASIYCSATLGEGCSHARVSALCSGLPVVTTSCGEMNDIAPDVNHVRLAPAGDPNAFLSVLRVTCLDIVNHGISIDWTRVESWRKHFAEERALRQWNDLIESLGTQ
jgi:glycosyltransferase involved in cell wall biosynthesis